MGDSAQSLVQICRRAYTKARTEGYDIVIVDTAGRQAVDSAQMQELRQSKSALVPDVVVDAMAGQEAATLTTRYCKPGLGCSSLSQVRGLRSDLHCSGV